jgi:adenylate kinase family enzyme
MSHRVTKYRKVAIVGNSGSGKSTLAKMLATEDGIETLDLDTIAWESNQMAILRDMDAQLTDVRNFCDASDEWVIEGCYASLTAAALSFEPYLIVLDPGFEHCVANCKSRPWEAHKYASKEEQDSKFEFLLQWVKAYYTRDDDMSLVAHRKVFEPYTGSNIWLRSLPDSEFTLSAD